MVESLVIVGVSSGYKDVLTFSILIAIMIFMPHGILGPRRPRRRLMRRAPAPRACSASCVWALLPHVLSRHLTDLLVFTAIYTIAGIGVGLLLGQCGIVNLGQAAFYGIGAYSCAYLTVELGYPNIAGFVVGAAISVAIALVVGWPVLRLTGYFLALATLALSIIASSIFYEWDWLTGGELGIGGIPKLDFFGFKLDTPGASTIWPGAWHSLSMLLVQQPGRTAAPD